MSASRAGGILTTAAFLSDLDLVRNDTRKHSVRSAATAGGAGLRAAAVRLLNDLLASELIWLMRYRRRYLLCSGKPEVGSACAGEEIAPADRLARRIVELGGEPDLDPHHLLSRSRARYAARGSVRAMIREDLLGERIVMESYAEVIRFLGDGDPSTREMLEENLFREARRAGELSDLLRELEGQESLIHAGC
jgi:bacterioferritin